MIRQEFNIEPYHWHVVVYYAVDCYFTDLIVDELRRLHARTDFIEEAYDSMAECRLDTGFTYSDLIYNETLMVVNRTSSAAEFENSLNHERQHLLMHIAQKYNMDLFDEEVCYLAGNVSMLMHPVAKHLLCSCDGHTEEVRRLIHDTEKRCIKCRKVQ